MSKKLKIIIGLLTGILLGLLVNTLIFWGLGVLIVKVFAINYTWTLFRGFIVGLIVTLIRMGSDKFQNKIKELIEKI